MSRVWPVLGWLLFIACIVGAAVRKGTDPTTEWLKAHHCYVPLMIGLCLVLATFVLVWISMFRDYARMERLLYLTRRNNEELENLRQLRAAQSRPGRAVHVQPSGVDPRHPRL